MKKDQEEHLKEVIKDFAEPVSKKYRRGQQEHGGNIWQKPTLPLMAEEVIDFWVYFHVHRKHIEAAKTILLASLKKWQETDIQAIREQVTKAYNILEFGNEKGVRLKDKAIKE